MKKESVKCLTPGSILLISVYQEVLVLPISVKDSSILEGGDIFWTKGKLLRTNSWGKLGKKKQELEGKMNIP